MYILSIGLKKAVENIAKSTGKCYNHGKSWMDRLSGLRAEKTDPDHGSDDRPKPACTLQALRMGWIFEYR